MEQEDQMKNDVHQHGDQSEHHYPTVLENITPTFISDSFNIVILIITTYGWFILAGLIFFYYIYSKYKPQYEQWKADAERKKELKSYDPNAIQAKHVAIDRARRRLQEKYDAEVEEYQQKQKQKEEAERLKKIQEWDSHKEGKGYHSKILKPQDASASTNSQKPAVKKTKLRQSDYNPLIGDSGSSCSWRPLGRRGGGG